MWMCLDDILKHGTFKMFSWLGYQNKLTREKMAVVYLDR